MIALLVLLFAATTLAPAPQGRAGRRIIPPTLAELALQPFSLHAQRIGEALEKLGAPLPADVRAAIEAARAKPDDAELAERISEAFESRVLFVLTINPEGRIVPTRGAAPAELDEADGRVFLVRIENGCGSTAPLDVTSPQVPLDVAQRGADEWLEMEAFYGPFLRRELLGIAREYRVLALGTHARGKRAATFRFDHRQGTQTATSPNAIDVLFDVRPAVPLTLGVREKKSGVIGGASYAGFVVRDERGFVHPSPSLRQGGDFRFHPQVYRGDGEVLLLAPGKYSIECTHGPETLVQQREIVLEAGKPARADFELVRWIDPAARGWWSGDHHIHAAGCAHFRTPGVGAEPLDMLRHTRGEDVKVGDCLTWGVGWYHQQRYFTGKTFAGSSAPYFLRYDLEISGFGSHRSGHLCLIGLTEQHYPGTHEINDWPNLGLTILAWAKKQGAVTGTAHSGLGLAVDSNALPCDIVPPFDNIGANEFVVDVTHELEGPDARPVAPIDIYGVGDTPWPWELNLWYRTLDVGFRPRIAGETDFPCLIDERVGGSRSYVKLDGALDVDKWIAGLAAGRSYVGDGRSHLIDFKVSEMRESATTRAVAAVGERDLELDRPSKVDVSVRAAALLPEAPDISIASRKWTETPYWHLERARIEGTREVEVECVVNSQPVARQRLVCDGTERELHFEVELTRSSWIALRILPSCHTNPIFVNVARRPVRASAASAEFLLKCVDKCWAEKSRYYSPGPELELAQKAYEHAREAYRARAAEARAQD